MIGRGNLFSHLIFFPSPSESKLQGLPFSALINWPAQSDHHGARLRIPRAARGVPANLARRSAAFGGARSEHLAGELEEQLPWRLRQ